MRGGKKPNGLTRKEKKFWASGILEKTIFLAKVYVSLGSDAFTLTYLLILRQQQDKTMKVLGFLKCIERPLVDVWSGSATSPPSTALQSTPRNQGNEQSAITSKTKAEKVEDVAAEFLRNIFVGKTKELKPFLTDYYYDMVKEEIKVGSGEAKGTANVYQLFNNSDTLDAGTSFSIKDTLSAPLEAWNAVGPDGHKFEMQRAKMLSAGWIKGSDIAVKTEVEFSFLTLESGLVRTKETFLLVLRMIEQNWKVVAIFVPIEGTATVIKPR